MSQQTATSPVTTRSQWPFLAALAAALALGLGAAAVAHGADIFVNPTIQGSADSQDCGTTFKPCKTIQFAIDKAAPGDTIHVEDGPYFEHLEIDKNLTIIGEPAGRVVDGGGNGTVITVFLPATVVITGLTIQNGAAVGSVHGGGIANNSTLTMNNCTVSNNSANVNGGGIANFGGAKVTLNNSTVSNNSANSSGGGIANFSNGEVTLNNSTVTDNAAGERGGGILNGIGGTLVFNSSTVANNTAVQNGGGLQNFGTVSGTGATITGNSAIGDGGGVDNHGVLGVVLSTIESNVASGNGGGVHNPGSFNLSLSTVKNNVALGGGGNISNVSSQTATLTNVTISGGTAARGGGIDNTGTVNLNNVTITKNTATTGDGGGIFNDTGATVNVRNTILAGNTDTGGEAPDCAGTLTSQGHNLVGKNTGCTILAATGDLVGTGGSPIDPLLGPLANNGGPALSHALLAGSPAIDAGDPSPPGSGGTACEATDQRGIVRPVDGNGDGIATCDIGAVERLSAIALVAAVLPSSRFVQVGSAATAFATILNAGPGTALGCSLALVTALPAAFTYQTTNAQNQVVGTANTPADIPAGQGQSFVFAFTPTGPLAPTEVLLNFACNNADPAPTTVGVNTFLLAASATPIPDTVAIALTPSADGILRLASAGAFAMATVNVGAPGLITVTADTGGVTLPVTISLCETNPGSGACLADPSANVQTQFNSGATRTFSVFVINSAPIPFDPANNRIQVHLEGDGGGGGTSVAVCSQPLCP